MELKGDCSWHAPAIFSQVLPTIRPWAQYPPAPERDHKMPLLWYTGGKEEVCGGPIVSAENTPQYGIRPRRRTFSVQVGNVWIGSEHPIAVQSMTNTDTADVAATVDQVQALAEAGSELVRVTVNQEEAAAAVPEIVERLRARGVNVPIVGDFHYNGHILLTKYPACRASTRQIPH